MLNAHLDPGFFSDSQLESSLARLADTSVASEPVALWRCRLQSEQALRAGQPWQQVPPASPAPWPVLTREDVSQQRQWLQQGAAQGRRIALPQQPQQLWASYKYAVMARSVPAYQLIGHQVARGGVTLEALWVLLEARVRVRPTPGGLRNALQHMWGYVSRWSESAPDGDQPARLLAEIQTLARTHGVAYLLASTALSELSLWVNE